MFQRFSDDGGGYAWAQMNPRQHLLSLTAPSYLKVGFVLLLGSDWLDRLYERYDWLLPFALRRRMTCYGSVGMLDCRVLTEGVVGKRRNSAHTYRVLAEPSRHNLSTGGGGADSRQPRELIR